MITDSMTLEIHHVLPSIPYSIYVPWEWRYPSLLSNQWYFLQAYRRCG